MPMEIELRKVEGVKELTAYASEGSATLLVEFDADYDSTQRCWMFERPWTGPGSSCPARQKNRSCRSRPRKTSPSSRSIWWARMCRSGCSTTWPLISVTISKRSPEVLEAELQGNREEQLEALIDPNALEAYQISNEELINTILRNNRLIPAGSIDTGVGRFSVKVPSVIEEAATFSTCRSRPAATRWSP